MRRVAAKRWLFPVLCGLVFLGAAPSEDATRAQTWRVELQRRKGAAESTAGYAEIWPFCSGAEKLKARTIKPDGTLGGARLIWASEGEALKVLFEVSGNAKSPTLEFSAAADFNVPAWEPRAGLVLETRARQGHSDLSRLEAMHKEWNIGSLENFRKAWESSPPLGCSLVGQVFHGSHLHGPNDDFLSWYSGFFAAPASGDYELAAISDDDSYVLVDGQLVASWPGLHPVHPGLRGEHSGKLHLQAGPHRLDYLHAQGPGETFAIAAWKPPGATRFAVMPEESFAPASVFEPARITDSGNSVPGYWEWHMTGHLMAGERALVFVEGSIPEAFAASGPWTWSFPDGSEVQGRGFRHLFLDTGMREIGLRVGGGDSASAATRRLRVHPCWSQLQEGPERLEREAERILERRDFMKTSITDLLNLGFFAARAIPAWLDKVGPALLNRSGEVPEKDAGIFRELYLHYSHPGLLRLPEAEKSLRSLAQRSSVADKPQATLDLGDFLIATLRPAWEQELPELLQSLEKRALDGALKRRAQILRADFELLRGDAAAAGALYATASGAAGTAQPLEKVRLQGRLEAARGQLRLKDAESAVDILMALLDSDPRLRREPAPLLVLIEALAARGDNLPALSWALRLERAAPEAQHHAELLYWLQELHGKLGHKEQAQRAATTLRRDYPLSTAAARLPAAKIP